MTARFAASRDQLLVLAGEPGGADDMDAAVARRQFGVSDGRGRDGEVEQPVGIGQERLDIGADRHAVLAEAGQFAGIASDHRRARRIDRARERRILAGRDRLNERPPHAPAGARHDQPHAGHRWYSASRRC